MLSFTVFCVHRGLLWKCHNQIFLERRYKIEDAGIQQHNYFKD